MGLYKFGFDSYNVYFDDVGDGFVWSCLFDIQIVWEIVVLYNEFDYLLLIQ